MSDFVVGRNPELALKVKDLTKEQKAAGTINIKQLVDDYLVPVKKIVHSQAQIKFENIHRVFHNEPENISFITQQSKGKFKPGTGQFVYIYDIQEPKANEQTHQTIKSKISYLEERPVRYFKTAKHAIGCPVNLKDDRVVIVELKDISDYPEDYGLLTDK